MRNDNRLIQTRDMIRRMAPVKVRHGTVVRTYNKTSRVKVRVSQSNRISTCECSPGSSYAVGDNVLVLVGDELERPYVIAFRGKSTASGISRTGIYDDPENMSVQPTKPTNVRVKRGTTETVVMWRPPLVRENHWFAVQRAKDDSGTDAETYVITQGCTAVNNDPDFTHFRVAGCTLSGSSLSRSDWTSWTGGSIITGEEYQTLHTGASGDEWDWPDQIILSLRNLTGGALVLGDVVGVGNASTVGTLSNLSVGKIDEEGYSDGTIGVCLEAIDSTNVGQVVVSGYVPQINLDAAATWGQLFKTSSTQLQATPVSVAEEGVFGQVLDSGSSPPAVLWNPPVSSSHDPVTLSGAEIQAILDISSQALDLDTQGANKILAGPTSGADAKPAFRDLVSDDMPSGIGSHEILFSQVGSVAVSNTTDETSILTVGRGSKTVPADTFDIGTQLFLYVGGTLSDLGNPTLNTRVYLGDTEICSTGADNLHADVAASPWSLEIHMTCRASGAAGSLIGGGCFRHDDGEMFGLRHSPVTIDTTEDLEVDVTVEWGAADATNHISSGQCMIEIMKVSNLAPVAPSGLVVST